MSNANSQSGGWPTVNDAGAGRGGAAGSIAEFAGHAARLSPFSAYTRLREKLISRGWNPEDVDALMERYRDTNSAHQVHALEVADAITGPAGGSAEVQVWLPVLVTVTPSTGYSFDTSATQVWLDTRWESSNDVTELGVLVAGYLRAAGGDGVLARAAFAVQIGEQELTQMRRHPDWSREQFLVLAGLAG